MDEKIKKQLDEMKCYISIDDYGSMIVVSVFIQHTKTQWIALEVNQSSEFKILYINKCMCIRESDLTSIIRLAKLLQDNLCQK